jgi:hypothetical protein
VALDRWFKKFVILGIVSYMDNACLKFELMGCEEPAVEPLLGYDYGYSPCVGKFCDRILNLTLCQSNLNPYCLGRKAAFFSVGI